MRFKRNNLQPISYAFFCRLQISLTMPNLSFRSQRELSTGLQLPQKDQTHIAISHCCQVCSQVGWKAPSFPQILDCKYWAVEQNSSWPRKSITHSTKREIAGILWKFLRQSQNLEAWSGTDSATLRNASGKTAGFVWAIFLSQCFSTFLLSGPDNVW